MANFDSIEDIKKLDKENVLGSINELPQQCQDAWDQASAIDVPKSYSEIDNIVMTGMGGSGLGARVIESVYEDSLMYPITRINDYDIPKFTDKNTLVICSSYSGTTEEIISTANQAIEKNAKWMAIGVGNTLIEMAKNHNVPYYQMQPKYNPSNQPRMAIGYSVIGQLVLASKAGLFKLAHEDIETIVKAMQKIQNQCNEEVETSNNPAKQLALKFQNRVISYISARHLTGAAHVVSNQLNENAKNMSFDYHIPELNHHIMEGLKHPQSNKENLFVFFVQSDLYPERIKQRTKITQDVVEKNNIQSYVFTPISNTKLAQAFELIQFGAYVNFYLSMLYDQNPAPIPWVDYFKEELGQPLGK